MEATIAPPQNRLAVAVAGAAFLAVFMGVAWMAVTMAAAHQAVDRLQNETVGYAMFLTSPLAGLAGGVAGFCAGFFGDRARWLRRWAAVAVVGVLLAVGFNVWMLRTTGPDSRPHAPVPSAR